jgi:hypothetical protein
LIVLVGIAVLLATAMAPLASVSICAILVPLSPLFGSVVPAPAAAPDPGLLPLAPADTPLASRAPPA